VRTDKFLAPYLPYAHIRIIAEEFITKYHPEKTIPIPIEEIVEFGLDIDIIPLEDLQEKIEVDGFISNDLKEIFIDKWVYENRENRARFTIAHEVGHTILHKALYKSIEFNSPEEWKKFVNSIPSREYGFLELHANNFAGLVLVPSESLRERFEEAVKIYESEGFDPRSLSSSDIAVEYISNWLARRFKVSAQVIQRRIDKEGLLS